MVFRPIDPSLQSSIPAWTVCLHWNYWHRRLVRFHFLLWLCCSPILVIYISVLFHFIAKWHRKDSGIGQRPCIKSDAVPFLPSSRVPFSFFFPFIFLCHLAHAHAPAHMYRPHGTAFFTFFVLASFLSLFFGCGLAFPSFVSIYIYIYIKVRPSFCLFAYLLLQPNVCLKTTWSADQ